MTRFMLLICLMGLLVIASLASARQQKPTSAEVLDQLLKADDRGDSAEVRRLDKLFMEKALQEKRRRDARKAAERVSR